ncbi:MAG: TonB-dependent receptor [Pseudomonadota bacterium]
MGIQLHAPAEAQTAASAAKTFTETYDFDIDKATLSAALDMLARRTQVNVLYPFELGQTAGLNPVNGRYTLGEALDILFRNTPFSGSLADSGVIVISHADSANERNGVDDMEFLTKQMATASAIAIVGASAAPASAQSDNDLGLEEIVVTAQKRSESLQDVPISVSAFSSASLETKALTNIAEIAAFAPNVTIDNTSPFGGSSQILSASIRGIGQNDFAANFEPGVGVYIDGVYYSRSVGAVVDLLDLERVEVLKGPQGTLFGRNTIGGALNVVTRDPRDEFGYKAEFTTGRFERTDFRGAVDIPLADTLTTAVAFSYKRRKGQQRIIPYVDPVLGTDFITDQGAFPKIDEATGEGGFGRRGGENVFNVRGKIKWEASDNVTVRVSADYTHEDAPATPSSLIATNAAANLDELGAGIGFDPISGLPTFGSIYNICINTPASVLTQLSTIVDPVTFGALNPDVGTCSARANVGTPLAGANAGGPGVGPRPNYGDNFLTGDIDTTFATGENFAQLDAYGFSGTVDWAVTEAINLKSITAYRRTQFAAGVDFDGSPIAHAETSQSLDQKQFTQELQLNGQAFSDRLDWLVGLYYFDESIIENTTFTGGEGIVQVVGPNDIDNQAFAAFGHFNLNVTDKFSVTAGIRYSYEDKTLFGGQTDQNSSTVKLGVPPFLHPDPSDTTLLFPPRPLDVSFNNILLKFGAEYQVDDDILTYVSYSEGFKSGGFTNRLILPVPCSSPGPGVPVEQCESFADGVTVPGVISLVGTDALQFDEEKAVSYEAGLKSQLLNNRLRFNVAAFFVEYTDLQVIVQQGVSPVTTNAGDAEAYGFEIEFQGLVTERFSVDGGIGFTEAEYTQLTTPEGFVNSVPIDGQLINTPKWNLNLGADYNVPVSQTGGEIGLHMDYTYNSQIANDAPNTPELVQGGVSVLNANATYNSSDEFWAVTFGVRNITDKRFIVSGFSQVGTGVIDGVFSRPREWFLTFRINSF